MVTVLRSIVVALLLALAGLALAADFYKFPRTTIVQERDLYLLRRPAASGFDNNTGSRNITGANLRQAFGNQTTAWAKITGKPTAYHPETHALDHMAGGHDTITLLPNQVDGLETALSGKAATSHTQAASTITGLATVATTGSYPDLSNRPSIPAACVDVFDGRDSTVPGPPGKTVLSGTSDPISSDGTNGDFFLNTVTATLFGPKASGTWPAGISLIGPQGIQGPPGPPGTVDQPTILGVIATQTDGALLEMQQGLTEAGTVPKLGVSDSAGNLTFYVDGAGTLTVKKLVIQ
jgi:hypothetical protein